MTEKFILKWIKDNLGPIIRDSIAKAKVTNSNLLYTEDWLAAMCYRETGLLIAKRIDAKKTYKEICDTMMGDYSQRPKDTEKKYHGFGFWQIDIDSFPDFVRSGDWRNPAKTCDKAISVLEGKRKYLESHNRNWTVYSLERCITAAYNNGEGNQIKVIGRGEDVDNRTHQKNYSAEVWRFREIYKSL